MPRLIDADALTNWIIDELRANGTFDELNGRQAANLIGRAIDDAPTVGGWISVNDRLPEENEAVNIVWMNTEPVSYYEHIKGKQFVATGVYYRGKWYWWSSIVQDCLVEYGSCEVDEMERAIVVTHWMPLPEPPKEVDR